MNSCFTVYHGAVRPNKPPVAVSMGCSSRAPFADKAESSHSSSRGTSPEDEIVTCLPYLMDCNHERGYYCSEHYEGLSPRLGKAELDSDQGAPVSIMENPGWREMPAGSTNARDVLALAAERASGSVPSEGAGAFNNVKTIMQQAACLQSISAQHRASSVQKCHGNCQPAFPISLQVGELSNTSLLRCDEHSSNVALHNFPLNCAWSSVSPNFLTPGMEIFQLREDAAAASASCKSSQLMHSEGIDKGSDGRAHIEDTQGSSYSLAAEDCRRDASMHAVSAGYQETLGNAECEYTGTFVRLAQPCREKEWQERCDSMCADMQDVFVPSCSGGSQSSADASAREMSTLGKKVVDYHDCQNKVCACRDTRIGCA